MKKTFRILGMALIAMIVSISFNACSSDDDDDASPADPSTHDRALIGTWVSYEEGSDWWDKTEVTFKSNGNFRIDNTYYDEEDGKDTYWCSGEWYTNNGNIYMEIQKSSEREDVGQIESGPYYISGNRVTFDGVTYIKK